MSLMVKNLAINAVYYGVTVGLAPWTLLLQERRVFEMRHAPGVLQAGAFLFGGCGVALQARCIVLFHRVGRGTPSPLVAPRLLVTRGPYRMVRNPMNIGELLVFLALAIWFESPVLLIYTVCTWLCFHLFVVRVEEPSLLKKFGEDYARYQAVAERWIPRIRSG